MRDGVGVRELVQLAQDVVERGPQSGDERELPRIVEAGRFETVEAPRAADMRVDELARAQALREWVRTLAGCANIGAR
jgi:hypothetical protein